MGDPEYKEDKREDLDDACKTCKAPEEVLKEEEMALRAPEKNAAGRRACGAS